jgi:hypothetical protein
MAKVYFTEDVNSITYFATKRAAQRFNAKQDEHERIIAVDAAEECERLVTRIKEEEAIRISLQCALRDLIDVADTELLRDTQPGRDAVKLMRQLDRDFIESCGL